MRYVLLGFLCLALTSCGLLSADQQQTALQVLDQMLMQGTISQEQYVALRDSVLSAGQTQWWQSLAEIVLGAALGYAGVRVTRGAPTQKVGIPANMVRSVSVQAP